MTRLFTSPSDQADRTYIRKAMEQDLLARDEEHALALSYKNTKDPKAMDRIISAYRRLVIAQASKFKLYGLPLADLIQEGTIGLIEALNRFDPERDVRFSTYASWWIKSYLQDYTLRNWSIVRAGTTTAHKSLFFNMRRLKARIQAIHGKNISEQDIRANIAQQLGVSQQDVDRMDARLGGDQSLNVQVGEDGDTELQTLLPAESPSPEQVVIGLKDSATRSQWLNEALSRLSDRDRKIIEQRHLKYEPVTLETMGQRLGISKERVRQLESRALQNLKRSLSERINTPSDLFTDF